MTCNRTTREIPPPCAQPVECTQGYELGDKPLARDLPEAIALHRRDTYVLEKPI